jgi:hypothetical protein
MSAARLLVLTLVARSLLCQTPSARMVALDFGAHNAKGDPVTDLRAEEIHITDAGHRYPIVHFRSATPADAFPHAVVVVVDQLMVDDKLTPAAWDQITRALREQPGSHLYFYLLTTHGGLFPIRAVPQSWLDAPLPDPTWFRDSVPTFDSLAALYRPTPKDLEKPERNTVFDVRQNVADDALQELAACLARVPGPRSIVWIGRAADGKPVMEKPGNTLRTTDGDRIDPIRIYPVGGHRAQLASVTYPQWPFRWSIGPHGDIAVTVARAVADARHYYRVTYLPPQNAWDGKSHAVEVTSTRRGVHIETRPSSYAAPKWNDLIAEGQPLPDLLALAPFDSTLLRLSAADRRSDLRVDAADVVFLPEAGRYTARLAVQAISYASDSPTAVNDARVVAFSLTSSERGAALRDGLRIPLQVDAAKVRAPIRIVVADLFSGSFGTVTLEARR